MTKITFWPNYLIWSNLVKKIESYHEHISCVLGVSDNRLHDRLYVKTWSSLCDSYSLGPREIVSRVFLSTSNSTVKVS